MNETNHPSSLATCTLIQDFLGVKDGGIYEAADYRKLSPGCYGEKSSAENALMARAFAVELREGRV